MTTWVFLKDMMLSEISQAEKQIISICVCVCVCRSYIYMYNKKKKKKKPNSKKENRCVFTRNTVGVWRK